MNMQWAYPSEIDLPRDVLREGTDGIMHLDAARLTDYLHDSTLEGLECADIDTDLMDELGLDDTYVE